MNGVRTIEDLRLRCVVDEITGCWLWRGAFTQGVGAVWLPELGKTRTIRSAAQVSDVPHVVDKLQGAGVRALPPCIEFGKCGVQARAQPGARQGSDHHTPPKPSGALRSRAARREARSRGVLPAKPPPACAEALFGMTVQSPRSMRSASLRRRAVSGCSATAAPGTDRGAATES